MQDFNWQKAHRSQRHREAEEIAILEWMFPPHTTPKSIWQRTEIIAFLIKKGRQRCVEVDGQEPEWIGIPIKAADFAWQLQHSEPMQIALIGFSRHIRHGAPRNRRLQTISQFSWVEKPIVSERPLQGRTVFTDAGKKSKTAVCVLQEKGQWSKNLIPGTEQDSLQMLELVAIIWAPAKWSSFPINVISDSQCAVEVANRIEDSLLGSIGN
ncbi:hypothetical protein WISP_01406 [Willisornis vidua]|uniref:RNase H type-1 domain-containing protein n=1 Tax=Willisornis vidua TaxID=1566151 RepID=A0ABQ9DUG7_9PASS|nr:hypothetical protein WISP_01406 [Willisornis vidua]